MSYRVCIPVAGTGSRLGELTRYLNKSLVSIANRPILSHIIEQFPEDAEFVLPLGYKGHLVREFLRLAYPFRHFFFAEAHPFEGDGSGLGLSLLSCSHLLQEPFVFISCDTLVREPIPALASDWMGYAQRDDLAPYRTLQVVDGAVQAILEKGVTDRPSLFTYIGLAGIVDYKTFWETMASGGVDSISGGESYGLRSLLAKGVEAHPFTWYDTGIPSALEGAREAYREQNAPHILEKAKEAIWFVGSRVIKFSDDQSFIRNRVARAKELKGFAPEILSSSPHMYGYHKVEGQVLSAVVTVPLMRQLLSQSRAFWNPCTLSPSEHEQFRSDCYRFYHDKTLERVSLFYHKSQLRDGEESINDVPMPTLAHLLEKVDWSYLADGIASRFHGDFHFENILWEPKSRVFTFLDWRQDFAGSLVRGDIYYDFAKLLHGLFISHELIDLNLFSVAWGATEIRYDFHRKQTLVQCEQDFYRWLLENNYDAQKVYLLTALIFLNIAPLHHHPYDNLLFALGKKMLHDHLLSP
jgi:hypothetical protein